MRLVSFSIALLLFTLGLPLQAEQLHFALYGQRDEMTLRAGAVDVDTRVGRLGVTFTGIYNPHLEASLDLGHAELTQSDNPATQGMSLYGQYGGVALRGWPLRSTFLEVWLGVDYTVLSVSGNNNGQETKVEWDDGGVAAGLVLHVGHVDLLAGVRQASLTGDEIASGTLHYTRSLSLEDEMSYWGGLDLYVDRTGTIGLRVSGGARPGIALRFARAF